MNNIKDIFEKVRSKFVLIVIIFLAIIALDTLVARVKMAKKLKDNPEMVSSELESAKQVDLENDTQKEEVENIKYVVTSDEVNAFELLKQNEEIEYKEYDFGVFVESINGVKGNADYFWSLYVNDEQSKIGVSEVILKTGDVVEWRYEKIKK